MMPNIDRDDENATRYEMPKPDIDEQREHQRKRVDFHSRHETEDQTIERAILATLEAHKRIIEAADVTGPVAWAYLWPDQPEPEFHRERLSDSARAARQSQGVMERPLVYGLDLLEAYQRLRIQHAELRRRYAARWIEFSKMHERAEVAESQLANKKVWIGYAQVLPNGRLFLIEADCSPDDIHDTGRPMYMLYRSESPLPQRV